ncbi:hypothetical protein L246_41505, partial [Salmonella enterica subsp. enterica serovar Worthington str. BCH-5715]
DFQRRAINHADNAFDLRVVDIAVVYPQIQHGLEVIQRPLHLRINHSDINDAQIKRIIGVIDRAALEIAELD